MSTKTRTRSPRACRVIVTVRGGVAEVIFKPRGVEVFILDYDVDGEDADQVDRDPMASSATSNITRPARKSSATRIGRWCVAPFARCRVPPGAAGNVPSVIASSTAWMRVWPRPARRSALNAIATWNCCDCAVTSHPSPTSRAFQPCRS
jgi:hypothetical protein